MGGRFERNRAGEDGGGLSWHAGIEAVNCVIAANAAPIGAGLYLSGGPGAQTLLNSTIAHPTAGSGEAVFVVSGTVAITNTIIAGYTTGIYQEWGSLTEDYNLYFGNDTAIHSHSGTLITGTHSLYGLDPRFADPAGDDYHLGCCGSPAIDAGTPNGAAPFDVDGEPRPQRDGYDIGADEHSGECRVYLPAVLRDR